MRTTRRSTCLVLGDCMMTTGGFTSYGRTFYPCCSTSASVVADTCAFPSRPTAQRCLDVPLLLLLLPHRCLDVQSRKEVVPLFLTGDGKNTSTKQKGSSCTFKSNTILSLVLSRCKLECQLVSNFMLKPQKRRGANNFSEVRHTFPYVKN